jgi:DNA polymerase-3 subunit beta
VSTALILDPTLRVDVPRAALVSALSAAVLATKIDKLRPISRGALITTDATGKTTLTTTDLSTHLTVVLPESTVEGLGSTVVGAKQLADLVGKLPSAPITLAVSEGRLDVRAGSHRTSMVTMPVDEFPSVPASATAAWDVTVPLATVRALLDTVGYAVPEPQFAEQRPALGGLYIEFSNEAMAVTATNGHRLATATAAITATLGTADVLVPSSVVAIVRKLIAGATDETVHFRMNAEKSRLAITTTSFALSVTVSNELFPNYRQVIPSEADRPGTVTVDRAALMGVVERVALCSPLQSRKIVTASCDEGTAEIVWSAETPESGTSAEALATAAIVTGLKVGINAADLLDALKVLADASVTFRFRAPHESVIFASATETVTATHVLMPLRTDA